MPYCSPLPISSLFSYFPVVIHHSIFPVVVIHHSMFPVVYSVLVLVILVSVKHYSPISLIRSKTSQVLQIKFKIWVKNYHTKVNWLLESVKKVFLNLADDQAGWWDEVGLIIQPLLESISSIKISSLASLEIWKKTKGFYYQQDERDEQNKQDENRNENYLKDHKDLRMRRTEEKRETNNKKKSTTPLSEAITTENNQSPEALTSLDEDESSGEPSLNPQWIEKETAADQLSAAARAELDSDTSKEVRLCMKLWDDSSLITFFLGSTLCLIRMTQHMALLHATILVLHNLKNQISNAFPGLLTYKYWAHKFRVIRGSTSFELSERNKLLEIWVIIWPTCSFIKWPKCLNNCLLNTENGRESLFNSTQNIKGQKKYLLINCYLGVVWCGVVWCGVVVLRDELPEFRFVTFHMSRTRTQGEVPHPQPTL
ncbi:hypothetical protein VP01_1283g2 [Puccinia sorghi]|uniref:Uncharacterized protein n=1 Tax=Puccinia sorghi TaxID=27349 RepID=A0A0L6VNK0_9BASI|nr:hypothetical protein VP01_1283g2 [Puccinia sorghi]